MPLARTIPTIIVAVCLATPYQAHAATTGTSAALSRGTCSVTMSPVSFGNHPNRGDTLPITVSVECPANVTYRLTLEGSPLCAPWRTMLGEHGTLAYRIMTPGGTVWCDGLNGTDTIGGIGTGSPETFVVRAVVVDDVTQKHAGTYSDVLRGRIEALP